MNPVQLKFKNAVNLTAVTWLFASSIVWGGNLQLLELNRGWFCMYFLSLISFDFSREEIGLSVVAEGRILFAVHFL